WLLPTSESPDRIFRAVVERRPYHLEGPRNHPPCRRAGRFSALPRGRSTACWICCRRCCCCYVRAKSNTATRTLLRDADINKPTMVELNPILLLAIVIIGTVILYLIWTSLTHGCCIRSSSSSSSSGASSINHLEE
ncbi:unnamed protein product, partial [Ectocarpus fasciculatus]